MKKRFHNFKESEAVQALLQLVGSCVICLLYWFVLLAVCIVCMKAVVIYDNNLIYPCSYAIASVCTIPMCASIAMLSFHELFGDDNND